MAKKSMVKTFDLTGVEAYKLVPEGRHTAKIEDIEEKTFSSGNDGFAVKFKVLTGIGKDGIVYENYPILDTALWKIKLLLDALGLDTSKKIKLDLIKLIGKKLIIETRLEDNEDKTYARIEKLYPLTDASAEFINEDDDEDSEETDDSDDFEEEEEEQPKAKAKKTKAKKQPEPKEDEEDDDDDWEDDDDE